MRTYYLFHDGNGGFMNEKGEPDILAFESNDLKQIKEQKEIYDKMGHKTILKEKISNDHITELKVIEDNPFTIATEAVASNEKANTAVEPTISDSKIAPETEASNEKAAVKPTISDSKIAPETEASNEKAAVKPTISDSKIAPETEALNKQMLQATESNGDQQE